ncbi:SPFH domain-containing protein [Flavobacterium phragmitis]|uniref:Membrane protease subunit, stomatin/prohibitin family, contains C-terminal Zn-ribbon domain n=1 Tax=Flavobacterium phragmitis TaxID=739143 RepID=A0A1I1WBN2_9FLAO|nr:SPFH domain-containing protein [Flavobacterium phragmitis]SFD90460.1 Membrane protease subunit, stomatin/prohibitin family, contains C-terminal Zn-ribbon domain [Flavobacterium phragmitis]
MGLPNLFRKQLSSVIEWQNQSPDLLFYKYESATDEIKNASKLIVSPGQGCIVVYQGKIEDVLTTEGVYLLETDNHPFITTFLNLRQNFESEYKMHLYYFRTAELVGQRWGTANPIKYVDEFYNFPVSLGAHGNYSIQLKDVYKIFANLVGSKHSYTADDMRELIISRITSELASYLATCKYSYREIDSHLGDISIALKAKVSTLVENIGLLLTDFQIEATCFDEETQNNINAITKMSRESRVAAEVGMDYTELEKLRALRDAAKNEGGLAGAGLQIGAGMELGKSLFSEKEKITTINDQDDTVMQLKRLKLLLDEKILTQEEFDKKKTDILNKL